MEAPRASRPPGPDAPTRKSRVESSIAGKGGGIPEAD